jgi:hypothetical protein
MENKFVESDIHNRVTTIRAPIIFNKNPLASRGTDGEIYLVTQFFINSNPARHAEIAHCLKENIRLGVFTKIYLINERIYTAAELQLGDAEMAYVEQVIYDGGARMTYAHVCRLIADKSLNGYIAIANSDIFFDKTLENVRRTCLATQKSLYALLRFEYNREKRLGHCKMYGPFYDFSQDTWIFHTNFAPDAALTDKLNFKLVQGVRFY